MGREDEQPTRQDVTLGYPSNSTRTYPGQTKVFRPLHGAHGGISFLPSFLGEHVTIEFIPWDRRDSATFNHEQGDVPIGSSGDPRVAKQVSAAM